MFDDENTLALNFQSESLNNVMEAFYGAEMSATIPSYDFVASRIVATKGSILRYIRQLQW